MSSMGMMPPMMMRPGMGMGGHMGMSRPHQIRRRPQVPGKGHSQSVLGQPQGPIQNSPPRQAAAGPREKEIVNTSPVAVVEVAPPPRSRSASSSSALPQMALPVDVVTSPEVGVPSPGSDNDAICHATDYVPHGGSLEVGGVAPVVVDDDSEDEARASPIQLAQANFLGHNDSTFASFGEGRPAEMASNAGWYEVQDRRIEELQRELDVERERKQVSMETQTDVNDAIPEECVERWFAGFSMPVSVAPGKADASDSEAGHSPAPPELDAGVVAPERQIRRRPEGSRSRSGGESGGAGASSRSSSSESSGSSSSSGRSKRQRATSSEGEGDNLGQLGAAAAALLVGHSAGGVADAAEVKIRSVADYSDLA